MLKHKPEGWYDNVSQASTFKAYGKLGSQISAAARQAKRASSTPGDEIISLEATYYLESKRRKYIDWSSGKFTKDLLILLRDETLSFSSIALAMNKIFQTTRFTRDMIASRSLFLRRLAAGQRDVWSKEDRGLK